MVVYDYIRDPDAIYRRSFEMIRQEVPLDHVPKELRMIAERLVHAGGMPEVAQALHWSGDAATAAREALGAGGSIYTDARMVAVGIMERMLPSGCDIVCHISDPKVARIAREIGSTRSAAALDLWQSRLAGSIVAIGNAPTALFRLLELLQESDAPRPAAIFAFPVGFVGAVESKQALIDADLGIPYVTLTGRMGGSAYAAAAINAVLFSLKDHGVKGAGVKGVGVKDADSKDGAAA